MGLSGAGRFPKRGLTLFGEMPPKGQTPFGLVDVQEGCRIEERVTIARPRLQAIAVPSL